MDVQQSIIVGVIAGIATSAIIAIAIAYFNKILIPWYQRQIYMGRDVSGEWKSTSKRADNTEISLIKLSQSGNQLSGVMSITILDSEGQPKDNKLYEFEGEYSERIVRLSGKNTNKKQIGFAMALMEVVAGGKKMKGIESWFSTTYNKVMSGEAIWEQNNA